MQFKFSALLSGLLLYAAIASAGPADEFITVWQSDNPGESGTDEIRFHGIGSGYTISWEEVGNELANNGTLTAGTIASGDYQLITFPTPGTYRVRVDPIASGTFTQFRQATDRSKLLEVSQWGTTAWSGFYQAFRSCFNMDVTATDVPDLSLATTLSQMFSYCYNLTGNSSFNSWNTENITDMSGMFWSDTLFNQPLGEWNTSNVTNMFNMFENADNFNADISAWNTAAVTNMGSMFKSANDFNQDISAWDVSAVTNMIDMFSQATAFNQPISGWDVSAVTNMGGMFLDAIGFNQDIGAWELSSISSMAIMFNNSGMDCINYSLTLNGWEANVATPDGISLGAAGIVYDSTALAAHTTLTTTKGWTISGDIYDEGCGTALPVTLKSFDAAYRAPFAVLSWQSGTESGLNYYSVEKSADGIYFYSISQVQAAGSGSDYNTELPQPEDRAFYRLKMTDLDGKTDYSAIRMVSRNPVKASLLSAFPNPVCDGRLHVKAAKPGMVRIFNCLGQQVQEASVSEGSQLIDVRSLANGIYLVNQGTETIRLVIAQ